jgi:hypothetical protein
LSSFSLLRWFLQNTPSHKANNQFHFRHQLPRKLGGSQMRRD